MSLYPVTNPKILLQDVLSLVKLLDVGEGLMTYLESDFEPYRSKSRRKNQIIHVIKKVLNIPHNNGKPKFIDIN